MIADQVGHIPDFRKPPCQGTAGWREASSRLDAVRILPETSNKAKDGVIQTDRMSRMFVYIKFPKARRFGLFGRANDER
jgi:hypothetical protein